jgi:hypothetical protein
MNGNAIGGLIEEIRVSGKDLSDDTLRLLSALERKVECNVQLTPTERSKVEGIYAYMCR